MTGDSTPSMIHTDILGILSTMAMANTIFYFSVGDRVKLALFMIIVEVIAC